MKLFNISKIILIFIASFIGIIKASFLTQQIEELKKVKEDLDEYNNANCISRNISFNNKSQLDVYFDPETMEQKKPVVINIHGGSWYNNDKMNSVSTGLLLHENDFVAVIPNYVLFPYGQVEDMINDVYTSIKWTFDNIDKFGGDTNNITVVAHSSGAHLLALTLIKAALSRKNGNTTLVPLPDIKRVVLMNGPYEFDEAMLKNINKEENEDNEDNLFKEISLAILGSNDSCPIDILKEYDDNTITTFGVEKFNIVYASGDNVVSETSANSLMAQMKRTCPSTDIQYFYLEGIGHDGIVNGIREKDEEIQTSFLLLIQN
ncbi:alpha/beta-hydrolase [Piromyces finnis]|uniref:Alpha/beta-hydrolase n=1 Tax=Piromyces finnis TaxID=1754191 RepID=A0A1Y1UXS0_9FUNG|nr:alpha/beta-hydrolase [Piromyces finnis]|eukprot:ORX42977.1 alpha/beta-hydrolase [Piromyces finnis]